MPLYNNYGEMSFHFGPIKNEHMGFCVGTDGSTLKSITEKTGAKIKIMKADSDHPDPWFLISGTPGQIKWARNWLNAVRKEAIQRIPLQNNDAGVEASTQEVEIFGDVNINPIDSGYNVDISKPYFHRIEGTIHILRNITADEIIDGIRSDNISLNEIINCPRNIQVAYFSGCDPRFLTQQLALNIGVISTKFGVLETNPYAISKGFHHHLYEGVVRVYYNSDGITYKGLMENYLRIIGSYCNLNRLPNIIFMSRFMNNLSSPEQQLVRQVLQKGNVEFRSLSIYRWLNY